MASLAATATHVKENYLPLIKSRQTVLLALTGAAGYLCQPPASPDWLGFSTLLGSLLLTISGCTVLNMLFDRDIDARMERTRLRPLAVGRVEAFSAAALGAVLLAIGLIVAAIVSIPAFLVILSGAILNVLVYTLWLKRRSAWSILWGGLAGGMPILAGRVLATGRLDGLGLLLALIIVLWIPSHNLTLGMLYSSDYRQAGVPTIMITYGERTSRRLVALSSFLVSTLTLFVLSQLGLYPLVFALFFVFNLGVISLALISLTKSFAQILTVLYKVSSLYLLIATLLLVLSGVS